jgi:outer membrane lipoprotein SlyB
MRKGLALGVVLLLGCGCDTMSNTDKGLLGGGALGAGAGALIGSLTGHAGAGALIGGAAGAVAGGVTGAAVDHEERREARAAAIAQAQQRPPLTVMDVVKMAQQHISDDIIINDIRQTGSVYNLTADDIIWLKGQGVSDVVVNEMLARRPGVVYVPARPVYVAEPAPVAVGVGFWGPRYHYWH